jgi:hypothetical protein
MSREGRGLNRLSPASIQDPNMPARTGRLELAFVDRDPRALCAELRSRRNKGATRFALFPAGSLAEDIIRASRSAGIDVSLQTSLEDIRALVRTRADAGPREETCIVLLHESAPALSDALLGLIDLPGGSVVAPITAHHWIRRPLFLISIPKSGTHLVYELVSAFGYGLGGNCPDDARGGVAYFINSMNPHTPTSFLDFKDSSSNLYHPFMRCPALFSYRNPLDIVVSEANYYHKDGRSAFWSYLSGADFDGRVRLLINDPFLLGTIRDRIMPFLGWLGVRNVIPVSYEELVGPRGGGSEELQIRLIWSLQLKLHVPGNPRDYASRIYNDKSATFTSGRLGTHKSALSEGALQDFLSLPQDFMHRLGYLDGPSGAGKISLFSNRISEFRNQPLVLSTAAVDKEPMMMLANYCNYNIVRFRGRYYAMELGAGPVRLESMSERELRRIMSDTDMTKLKQQIMLRPRATLLQRFLRSVGHRLRRRRQEMPAKAVE